MYREVSESQEMIPDQEEDEKNTVVIEDDDWIDNDLGNCDESTWMYPEYTLFPRFLAAPGITPPSVLRRSCIK